MPRPLEVVAERDEPVPRRRRLDAPRCERRLLVEDRPPVVRGRHEDRLAVRRHGQRPQRVGEPSARAVARPQVRHVQQQALGGIGVRDGPRVPGEHVRRRGRGQVGGQLGAELLGGHRVHRHRGARAAVGGHDLLEGGLRAGVLDRGLQGDRRRRLPAARLAAARADAGREQGHAAQARGPEQEATTGQPHCCHDNLRFPVNMALHSCCRATSAHIGCWGAALEQTTVPQTPRSRA